MADYLIDIEVYKIAMQFTQNTELFPFGGRKLHLYDFDYSLVVGIVEQHFLFVVVTTTKVQNYFSAFI